MLTVVAKVTAKEDQIEAVKAGLQAVVAPTRAEEGWFVVRFAPGY